MQTTRLYRTDRYLTTNTTTVTHVDSENGTDVITTAESVFYPLGGGQPSDTGTVSLGDKVFSVIRASDESIDSDVRHHTDAPAGTFREGDTVTLTIDWDQRFRNMQRHLGEHMLSGAMYDLFGGTNKGFHMGEEYVTIDIDLGGRMLTEEELDLAERTVNEAVWADLPVTVTWFDDYDSSLVMPVRKQVPHEGKVSIVTVGDLPDPFDCIACCGVHPAYTSEVGLVAIYKCEPNKGMNRIYLDCGAAAKEKLSADSRLLADIAKKYSCSAADLPARLEREEADMSSLKARLAALSSYVKDHEKERILADISAQDGSVYTYQTEILSVDELLKLGFAVLSETEGKVLLFTHPESLTCLLFSSGDTKCGRIVKENAPKFGGRGGGRDDNARAIFTAKADLRSFASAVCEML